MSRLKIYKEGQFLFEVLLSPHQEWIAGRGKGCSIPLEGEHGISRQHFKVFYDGEGWKLQVMSRYGELYWQGEKVTELTLAAGVNFSVPPYEFQFEETTSSRASAPAVEESAADTGSFTDNSDRTMIGIMPAHPFLKVMDGEGQTLQVFRLEGHSWVAGRDTTCAIFIDYSKFSRRHFEIRNQEGAFAIKDLGSSNGTLLNGGPVSTQDWMHLKSGDVISVADWNLHFEVRDANYEDRLQEIPDEFRSPMIFSAEAPVDPTPFAPSPAPWQGISPSQMTGPFVMGAGTGNGSPLKKMNWVRLMMIGLVVVGGLVYFLGDNAPAPQAPMNNAKNITPFEKLAPQQQQFIKDTYRLADRLFKEGRYELAKQEVAKIHAIIPSYEESKNIEKLATIAIQTQVEQKQAEVREKDKIEMEEKIQHQVAECRQKLNPDVTMEEIDACLGPVIALNPDHPAMAELKEKASEFVAIRQERQEKKAEYLAQVRRHKALFEKAEKVYQSGQPLVALKEYDAVVKSRLPDPENLKSKAQRQIASIQQQLSDQTGEMEKQAEQASSHGDLKTAVQSLQKAVVINPDNETLKGKLNSALAELKKSMQALYQEAILEESVGEVDTAKAKWKKIIEQSLPEEDYYKKSKMKLKKYGID
jgi:pSer/pThr/pTyr-binding forkhead associated (FHA) protein/tetratricopeptide (TPR) repeat protein